MKKCLFSAFTIIYCFTNALLAQSSLLNNGYWVQLQFNQTGVYKISTNDLKSFGFDVNALNPQNIHFYSIQGTELNQLVDSNRTHIAEIPIQIVGQEDGKMDPADYILLFKSAVKDWSANQNGYTHKNNFYNGKSYGILGVNNIKGKRIASFTTTTSNPAKFTVNEFRISHDSDMVNPTNMGRYWVGEKLGNESLERTFVETILPGSDTVEISGIIGFSCIEAPGKMIITVNGVKDTVSAGQIDPEVVNVLPVEFSMKVPVSNQQVVINLKFIRSNSKSSAYLDNYNIVYRQKLDFVGNQFPIYNTQALLSSGEKQFEFLSANPDYSFWEVGDAYSPFQIAAKSLGSKTCIEYPDTLNYQRLWAFNPMALPTPKWVAKCPSTNLFEKPNTNLLILTSADFISAAKDLAEFRTKQNGLTTMVVNVTDIYADYGAGQQDIVSIRNYLQELYKLGNGQLKYVLLFGSTSFDPQNRVANNTNFIPTFHSNSYNKQQVYCLDDFFGMFEHGKGNPEIRNGQLKVAIGRIPCRTLTEANGVVQKLKRYSTESTLGKWRNQITFVTDDADVTWEGEFMRQTEGYTKNMAVKYPNIRVNKIYSSAYKQITNGNNEKYPDVSLAINKAMTDGSLFMNYQGHGGEKGWAQEEILDIPMINAWKNQYKMPILFTATCEFSRFDDPKLQSAGELTLLNPNGGAIALMSTTRLVFVSGNEVINNAFWKQYGFPQPNEPIPSLGEMFQRLKNRPQQNFNTEDNKFALLGDPSMPMNFPKHLIQIDSVNHIATNLFTDTLRAFSVVRLKGHINERLKGKMTSFNGTLDADIYDKPLVKYALDNDNQGVTDPFDDESSVLYKGTVSVVNGEFELVFSIPKDINYSFGLGRAIFYAQNGETDATGAWKFVIGGSLPVQQVDSIGPKILPFMNDTTFISNSSVSAQSSFVGRVFDLSGLNATGAGIGRDMQLILDPGTESEELIIVNDFFTYDKNSYQQGTIVYPFEHLTPGEHVIRCKVWDIYNNSGVADVAFKVVPGRQFTVNESGAKPNPAGQNETTQVWVNHNLAGEDIKVQWQVYNTVGALLDQGEKVEMNSTSTINAFEFGNNLHHKALNQTGFYFYKIVLTTSDGLNQMVAGKFIKLQ